PHIPYPASTDHSTTQTHTLSLHDALPISVRIHQLPGRIIWLYPDHHIHRIQPRQLRLHCRLLRNRHHVETRSPPGMTMLTITGHGHSHPAKTMHPGTNRWQGHDRRLGTRYGQAACMLRCPGPATDNLFQTILRLRKPLPYLRRNCRNRPRHRINAGGEIEPLLTGNAPAISRCVQSASMLRQFGTIEHCHPIPPSQNTFRLAAAANNTNSHSMTPRWTNEIAPSTVCAEAPGPLPSTGRCLMPTA